MQPYAITTRVGYFITKADDPEQTETDFPLLSETLDNQVKSRLTIILFLLI